MKNFPIVLTAILPAGVYFLIDIITGGPSAGLFDFLKPKVKKAAAKKAPEIPTVVPGAKVGVPAEPLRAAPEVPEAGMVTAYNWYNPWEETVWEESVWYASQGEVKDGMFYPYAGQTPAYRTK